MMKTKVLLTGGSGLVGRNFLEHPNIDDFEVCAPSRKELNLTIKDSVYDYLDKYRPDIIVHAAGKVGGIQANIRDPRTFLLENLEIGKNIVLAAADIGIKKLLNLASSCIYPKDYSGSLKESMMLDGKFEPTNEGYAIAKFVVARLCEYVSKDVKDLSYKTIIPCNLFGKYDSFEEQRSHLLAAIIRKIHVAIKCGHSTVEIWGDGSSRREFLYAGDFADFLVNAIQRFESLPDRMNVGLGRDLTIEGYYRAVADVLGFQGEFTYDLTRPSGMKRKLLDIELQSRFGWSPTTSMEDGIKIAYEYYLESSPS